MRINRNFNINLTSIYTFLVVSFPIFYRYLSPVANMTLSEFLIFLFALVAFFYGIEITKGILPLMGYMAFSILVAVNNSTGDLRYDAIGTTARLLFLYGIIYLLNKKYFDWRRGVNYIHIWAMILSVYSVLQTLFAQFGIFLTTYIPFLPRSNEMLMDEIVANRVILYNLTYRSQSFLNEPAHLCQYLLLALVLYLFCEPDRKKIFYAVFCTLVMILSRSSTGIILSAFVWVIYAISTQKISKRRIVNRLILGTVGLLLLIMLGNATGIFNQFFRKMFGEVYSFSNIFNVNRFSSIKAFIGQEFSLGQILVGNGMIPYGEFIPGIVRIYYYWGVIGIVIVVYMFVKLYRNCDFVQKRILIVYLVLQVGTEVMFGNFAVLYMGFITAKNKHQALERINGEQG